MRAVIVGGGIGGLAAGVALRRVGIESLVIERADAIREVGAGLSIWSNAVNALRALGVSDRMMPEASVVERNTVQTGSGRMISASDFTDLVRDAGAPSVCVHRAVLQRILLEELPPSWVRTGARCAGFDGSAAILDDGERIEGDFLIGADGIASVIRAGLHGTEPPRYAGYTCWRGILRAEGVLAPHSALMAVGGGRQFGLWPCGPGRLYWFFTYNAPQGTKAGKAEIVKLCSGWAPPAPDVLAATPEDAIVQNDIVDRPPLRWWGHNRVTLLGDAAHATTPNLGQGACMALEDAVVLAHCMAEARSVESGLREYESTRLSRTTDVVRESWMGGRILQTQNPALESIRNWLMASRLGRRMTMRSFHRLLTYRVPALPAGGAAAG